MKATARASLISASLGLVLAGAVGCAKPKPAAVTPLPPQALEVPVVPPRVLAPLPVEPAPSPAEPQASPAPRPVRPRPRADATSARPDATESPKAEAPPAEPAPPESRPETSGAVLQTPQTADDAEAERKIRDTVGRAARDLGRVNIGALSRDARAQYDTARRFLDQAQGALKVRNYLFARYLADKAAALASGLLGR